MVAEHWSAQGLTRMLISTYLQDKLSGASIISIFSIDKNTPDRLDSNLRALGVLCGSKNVVAVGEDFYRRWPGHFWLVFARFRQLTNDIGDVNHSYGAAFFVDDW